MQITQQLEGCRTLTTEPPPLPRLHTSLYQLQKSYLVQIEIGPKFRRLTVADARAHADRIHDLCDRVEVLTRETD